MSALIAQPKFGRACVQLNWSINTDPQQQEAASPLVLWSGYFQRYAVPKQRRCLFA
jgi:hypothetical protein